MIGRTNVSGGKGVDLQNITAEYEIATGENINSADLIDFIYNKFEIIDTLEGQLSSTIRIIMLNQNLYVAFYYIDNVTKAIPISIKDKKIILGTETIVKSSSIVDENQPVKVDDDKILYAKVYYDNVSIYSYVTETILIQVTENSVVILEDKIWSSSTEWLFSSSGSITSVCYNEKNGIIGLYQSATTSRSNYVFVKVENNQVVKLLGSFTSSEYFSKAIAISDGFLIATQSKKLLLNTFSSNYSSCSTSDLVTAFTAMNYTIKNMIEVNDNLILALDTSNNLHYIAVADSEYRSYNTNTGTAITSSGLCKVGNNKVVSFKTSSFTNTNLVSIVSLSNGSTTIEQITNASLSSTYFPDNIGNYLIIYQQDNSFTGLYLVDIRELISAEIECKGIALETGTAGNTIKVASTIL